MKAFLVDLENKPGELARIAEALGSQGVNITAVSGATCGETGRVALLTSDEQMTRTALGGAGARFDEMETVETSMGNEPGTLGQAARRLADAGVNIESILPVGMSGNDVRVAFVTNDAAAAREALATTSSTTG
jgi:hypothetical protein